ncbi:MULTISPECIES: SIR2 family NAD-dependent protein deacylase [unclassified Corallococcus]|uniref:SIR2 family NAD-dependent protein deacylase n=1 Tax=unclassified Corallococcus TaxID=2685029 RepID=UPI001A8F5B30|nr:NAD-dependent deacylase [Corallococcus sp. NCRR]MBN9686233.1 NAD-dependent deacylase [Corallococcus sp. NCSPR001]WAS82335.1 NAD-dependent deacylase [Corallococcus sp. NCRR]
MEPLVLDSKTRLLVLTGAGVSAESGVPTFRGMNGLWENHPVEAVASPQGFESNPALVWRFYSQRRAGAADVKPNPGHDALVHWEQHLGDRFLLATQNVDGLHTKAGSQRVVDMHGNLFRTKCADCQRAPFADTTVHPSGTVPKCDSCGGRLRPDIVWFGEMLDPKDLARIGDFITRDDGTRLVFLAAGTSGAVWPAAGIVDEVRSVRGDTWLVNYESAANTERFHHFVQGMSGQVLPTLAKLA